MFVPFCFFVVQKIQAEQSRVDGDADRAPHDEGRVGYHVPVREPQHVCEKHEEDGVQREVAHVFELVGFVELRQKLDRADDWRQDRHREAQYRRGGHGGGWDGLYFF